MKKLPFKQVDVFTKHPFQGNPVAVVLNAEGLSSEQMQQIANWTNLSETTFVLPSAVGDYRLRIFTPQSELPFAGHPTIGSAHAVREAGIVDREKKNFVQECGAGSIALKTDQNGAIFARVPKPKLSSVHLESKEWAGSIATSSILEAITVDVGPIWIVGRLEQLDTLYSLKINASKLASISQAMGVTGFTGYVLNEDGTVHVRSFAPAQGVLEDPVCGSGNAAVAAHIKATDRQNAVGEKYTAYQGKAVGRDGQVEVCFEGDDILIGGFAVTAIDGEITV